MLLNATEKSILEAAKLVFCRKGLAGARMQEIADEAKINEAMLHYYFRSKQELFETVFIQASGELAPLLNTILIRTGPFLRRYGNSSNAISTSMQIIPIYNPFSSRN